MKLKQLGILALAAAFSLGTLTAGEMTDGIMMKDGKMMVMKSGKSMMMTETMTLSNGTKVMTDGSVMMADGKKAMLTEGQSITMDGKMDTSKEAPDKAPNHQ